MVVEYSAAQHGGIEPAPTDQYPIATSPGASAQVVASLHDAPEPVLPSTKLDDAPEPFVTLTRPEYPVNKNDAHELPEKQDDKSTEATVTEDPASKSNGLISKKILLIGIIVLLVVVVVGLGVGLGLALSRRHPNPSSSTTTTQITSLTASTQIMSTTSVNPSSAPESTGSLINPPSPSSTNVATGQDVSLNDQLTTVHVSSWFYTGQTESQINQLCTQNNARITQIRVDNGTVPTFTVLMIQNTGLYNSSWWWYYGPNSYDQGTDRRIISVDPYYDTFRVLQFAVVQVPNSGSQDRGWWWYFGQSTGSITSLLSQNNARLVALRGYNDNGAVVYVIIMAENVDQDFIQSEWLTGITVDTINSQISSGLRLLSLSPNPSKDWDAIFVADTGSKWGWYYGLNFSGIRATTSQNNMRMVDISPYMLDGQNVFATVETDNSQ